MAVFDFTPLLPPDLPPPAELSPKYHGQWQRYLDAPDNKAFALSPTGRFAWRSPRTCQTPM